MTTWVVVADRLRARLFEAGSGRPMLTELEDLVHPEAREHERELVNDRQGREVGPWGHQTFEPRTRPRDKETGEFIRELGDRLRKGVHDGTFDRLVLCAEPGLLGRLRRELPGGVTRAVVGEVNKDLADKPRPEETEPYLAGMV